MEFIGQISWLHKNLLLENTLRSPKIDLNGRKLNLYSLKAMLFGNFIKLEEPIVVHINEYDWDDKWIKCKTKEYAPTLFDGCFELVCEN